MVKVIIQVEGKEDKILEGEAVVLAVVKDEIAKTGVVGSLSIKRILNITLGLEKAIQKSISDLLSMKDESEEK